MIPPEIIWSPQQLLPEEIDQLIAFGYSNAMKLVSYASIDEGPIVWTKESTKGDVKLYKGKEPNSYKKTTTSGLYCSVTEIAATLEEVVDLFRTDTSQKAKEYCQRVGKGLLDAVNLYTLVPSSPDSMESSTIKWMLAKSALDGIVRKRDGCVIQTDHAFDAGNDKRGWVRVFKSIELSCCPELENSMGYVRVNQRGTGHVFIESDRPGYLHATYVNDVDLGGNTPQWVVAAGLKQRCWNLVDIDTFLRQDRLSRGDWLYATQLVSLNSKNKCFRCRRKFGLFHKRSNCLKCGQVVCTDCNRMWNVKIFGKSKKMAACTVCSIRPPRKSTIWHETHWPLSSQTDSTHSKHCFSRSDVSSTNDRKSYLQRQSGSSQSNPWYRERSIANPM